MNKINLRIKVKRINKKTFITECKGRNKIKFSEILYMWLNNNMIKIKQTTYDKYKFIIDVHIAPELGVLYSDDISSNVINEFLKKKVDTGRIKNGDALSPSYVKTMGIIIESSINLGVKEGYCKPLKTPIYKPNLPKKSPRILNTYEENTLLDKAANELDNISIGILLGLVAGLRVGEVCALTWKDIDFDNQIIKISKTVSRVINDNGTRKNTYILSSAKTNSSIRTVPIAPLLYETLIKHKKNAKGDFIVSTNETFLTPNSFEYKYKKYLKKYNIDYFNFHVLRHTFATKCAQSGIDAKAISLIIGHSTPATTLNIYVHPPMDMIKQKLSEVYKA